MSGPKSLATISQMEVIQQLNDEIGAIKSPPYTFGSIIIPKQQNINILIPSKNTHHTDWSSVSFPKTNDSNNIQPLLDLATPSTVAIEKKNVLDTNYRNALSIKIASNPNISVTGMDEILYTLTREIEKKLMMREILIEFGQSVFLKLNSINVYQEGHFFKAHEDCPINKYHLGTLVMVMPSPHQGGDLILTHHEKLENCTSKSSPSQIIIKSAESSNLSEIKWSAFFIDVSHEVAKVTSGTRISLAYDILLLDRFEPESTSGLQNSPYLNDIHFEVNILPIEMMLKKLYNNPVVFPQGIKLGVPLKFIYGVDLNETKATEILRYLKGCDAALYNCFRNMEKLNCKIGARFYLDLNKQWLYVGDSEDEHESIYVIPEDRTLGRIDEFGDDECKKNIVLELGARTPSEEGILFLSGRDEPNGNQLSLYFLDYGNDWHMGTAHANVMLTLEIPSFENRIIHDSVC